jgi:hypothetical protein
MTSGSWGLVVHERDSVTEIVKRTLAQEAAFRHCCWPDALRFVAQQVNIGAVVFAREPGRSKVLAAPEIPRDTNTPKFREAPSLFGNRLVVHQFIGGKQA